MSNHRVFALVVLLGSHQAFAQVPIQAEPEAAPAPAPEPAPEPASIPEPEPEPAPEPAPAPAPAPAKVSNTQEQWREPADVPEDQAETQLNSAKKAKKWMLPLALTHERFTGGDYNDSNVLVDPSYGAFVLIPELGSGTGFNLGLGYGSYPEQIGGVGFWTGLTYSVKWMAPTSSHTPSDPEGVLHDLDVPLRIGYRASRELLPYIQISYGFSFLSITGVHGYVDALGTPAFDNESSLFLGRTFRFGIGSLFPLTESFSVDAFVGYGLSFVDNVDGAELDDALNAGVLTLSLGPTFFF